MIVNDLVLFQVARENRDAFYYFLLDLCRKYVGDSVSLEDHSIKFENRQIIFIAIDDSDISYCIKIAPYNFHAIEYDSHRVGLQINFITSSSMLRSDEKMEYEIFYYLLNKYTNEYSVEQVYKSMAISEKFSDDNYYTLHYTQLKGASKLDTIVNAMEKLYVKPMQVCLVTNDMGQGIVDDYIVEEDSKIFIIHSDDWNDVCFALNQHENECLWLVSCADIEDLQKNILENFIESTDSWQKYPLDYYLKPMYNAIKDVEVANQFSHKEEE